jgi:hypothetical protein
VKVAREETLLTKAESSTVAGTQFKYPVSKSHAYIPELYIQQCISEMEAGETIKRSVKPEIRSD